VGCRGTCVTVGCGGSVGRTIGGKVGKLAEVGTTGVAVFDLAEVRLGDNKEQAEPVNKTIINKAYSLFLLSMELDGFIFPHKNILMVHAFITGIFPKY
jgi:hypothetical protein